MNKSTMPNDSNVLTLEQRVTELYDRMLIGQLVAHYAHAVRERDADKVLSLFVDNGPSVDFDRSAIADGEQKQGLAAMRKVYADGFEALEPWPQMSDHLIEIQDSSNATGIVSLEFRTGKKNYQVAWVGIYRDVYQKINGVWKFKARSATVQKTPLMDVWAETKTAG
jgi:ketosteroid isomerase-like protein